MPKTALRLVGAFVAVLGLFATAMVVTLRTFDRLASAEIELAALDQAKHTGHLVAGLVREEYIHQAHTIIEWDLSHIDHYEPVVEETVKLTRRLRGSRLTAAERKLTDTIARLVLEIDATFRREILPSVGKTSRDQVLHVHERTEALVTEVVEVNDQLNASLEQRAIEAHAVAEGLRQRARVLALCCFLPALLVAALSGLTARSIVGRLSELEHGALKVACGDLSARIPVVGSDEFAALASTFNDMAASLSQHQDRLLRAERFAVLGQIAAGVAHEINNPLGVILGYAKLLERDEPGTAQTHERLRIIQDEARQCQRIVASLLDLARPARSSRTEVNLSEIAREAIDRLADAGKVGERGVRVTAAPAGAVVWADRAALRQVVSNLVMNAIEATPESGRIDVTVREPAGRVELEVTDDGCGISKEDLPRVCTPFFTTKAQGTGLGLAISAAVVGAHDGQLEVTSRAEGGTRVLVRLPSVEAASNEVSP